mmetsp:Transcript_63932/g.151216  ORF Transcript_63932/g.151216 Transcript_63932/m.151216 type:complete len:401 (-) Transcript_63932:1602-2804(-)
MVPTLLSTRHSAATWSLSVLLPSATSVLQNTSSSTRSSAKLRPISVAMTRSRPLRPRLTHRRCPGPARMSLPPATTRTTSTLARTTPRFSLVSTRTPRSTSRPPRKLRSPLPGPRTLSSGSADMPARSGTSAIRPRATSMTCPAPRMRLTVSSPRCTTRPRLPSRPFSRPPRCSAMPPVHSRTRSTCSRIQSTAPSTCNRLRARWRSMRTTWSNCCTRHTRTTTTVPTTPTILAAPTTSSSLTTLLLPSRTISRMRSPWPRPLATLATTQRQRSSRTSVRPMTPYPRSSMKRRMAPTPLLSRSTMPPPLAFSRSTQRVPLRVLTTLWTVLSVPSRPRCRRRSKPSRPLTARLTLRLSPAPPGRVLRPPNVWPRLRSRASLVDTRTSRCLTPRTPSRRPRL